MSSGSRPSPPRIEPPVVPLPDLEAEGAKEEVNRRRKGRSSTILAGKLNSQHGKILLGE